MSVTGRSYRVFHLIKGLGRGGAEVLLSEGLRYSGSHFKYGYGYFLPWKDALVNSLRSQGAEVFCFSRKNPLSILASVHKVVKLLAGWKPDLLHCHLPLAGMVGRLAAKRLGIPVVYTEHNLQERYHPLTRQMNLWTWKFQSRVIAVSSQVANSIHAHTNHGVPVDVVPNGLAVETFRADPEGRIRVRKELGLSFDGLVVGTVAIFRRTKNLHDWLAAGRLIQSRFPDVHFLLVGDGPVRQELETTAKSLGLEGFVHFTGLKENPVPYLAAMDIYMSSSEFEGLPVAMLEAMAMQLPVVATAVGGIPAVVVEGQTGYTVKPRDPVGLCDKATLLLNSAGLREEFGRAGRRVVEERFSMKRMMKEVEDVYLSVLSAC